MTPNYHDHRVKIPPEAFPWTVGHRLHKSRRRGLTWAEAKKYYRKIALCKTRYKFQEIPFDILITRTAGAREKQLIEAVTDHNPLWYKLKEHELK